ncbi:hypothetical protein EWM64_g2389 [Hericium alpestre]|uniref:Uncharacterized protein n=1 Tax=Hericium alpestre TaxID=135208 RepID=A0A4Z0A5M2_9AGAM|nr:hypothetical protein EWM64_g2389 [Hericium alpestre]
MRAVSPRDAILVLVGAASMHLFTLLFAPMSERSSIVVNTHLTEHSEHAHVNFHGPADSPDLPLPPNPLSFPPVGSQHPEHPLLSPPPNLLTGHSIPETTLLAHAPGWTIFRNLYMSNGTLFIVTSHPESFPSIEMMTSTGLPAFNTPESIAERTPTEKDMAFLTPAEARKLWIGEEALGEKNRVFKVEGRTLLFNDPNQFLNHYYHFCAELFFGLWAFWTGTFRSFSPTLFPSSSFAPITPNSPSPPLPANAPIYLGESEKIPTWTRAIFAHSTAEEWRDSPGFNAYFLRAAFPSLTVETQRRHLGRCYHDIERARADWISSISGRRSIDRDRVTYRDPRRRRG